MSSVKTRDPLEYILESLEDPEFQTAINKLVDVVKNLEKSGILDLLETITDPMVLDRLAQLAASTGLMKLGDNIENLLDIVGDITSLLEKPVEPIGPSKLLLSLKDPDVARGLTIAIELLRLLGKLSRKV